MIFRRPVCKLFAVVIAKRLREFSKQWKNLDFFHRLHVAFWRGKIQFTISIGLKDVLITVVCRKNKYIAGLLPLSKVVRTSIILHGLVELIRQLVQKSWSKSEVAWDRWHLEDILTILYEHLDVGKWCTKWLPGLLTCDHNFLMI